MVVRAVISLTSFASKVAPHPLNPTFIVKQGTGKLPSELPELREREMCRNVDGYGGCYIINGNGPLEIFLFC